MRPSPPLPFCLQLFNLTDTEFNSTNSRDPWINGYKMLNPQPSWSLPFWLLHIIRASYMWSHKLIPAGFLRPLFLSAWKRGLVGWIGFHRVEWAGEESADFSGWRSWVDMFAHVCVGNDTLKTPFLMPFLHQRRNQRKQCFEFFQLLHFFGGAAESTIGMVGNQIFSPRGPEKEGSGESWDRRWCFSRFLTHHRIPLEAAASKVLKQFATYTVHLRKLFLDLSDHEVSWESLQIQNPRLSHERCWFSL